MNLHSIFKTGLMILSLGLLSGVPAALAAGEVAPDNMSAESAGGVQPAALTETKIPPEVLILRGVEKELKQKFARDIFRPSTIPSLVFTPSQHALLSEARIGFNARMPMLKDSSGNDLPDPDDPNYRPPPSVRKLQLGGIVFNTPDEWTIYLNGKRITPDLIPTEAVDLRVYKDFIELRWFDAQTNKIFPVRLRPNQTFNLDARIFLPG